MVEVMTITEILNLWNELGVFSYAIPFLLIFAVMYAILVKTNILGHKDRSNTSMEAIVSVAVGLLSLQFDMVSEFFSVIFPKFGVGLSIFLVLIIMLAFFHPEGENNKQSKAVVWIGWVVGIGVVLWSLSEWDNWSSGMGFGGWFSEYIWALIVLGVLIALIVIFSKGSKANSSSSSSSE